MRLFTGIKKVFREIFYPVTAALVLASSGCNLQVRFLPQIDAPYISEVEFLKQVDPNGSEIRKIRFENDTVTGTFYIFVRLENIENRGTLKVKFYRSVIRSAPAMLKAVNRRLIRSLNGFLDMIPFPHFVPGLAIRAIRELPGPDAQDADLISAFCRACSGFGLRLPVLPPAFNLGRFFVERYEKINHELSFCFGEEGNYYEYILFIDKIQNPEPGHYRYGIFLNKRLILDDMLEVQLPPEKN